jgi:patatin-like phospholipase/acyl hydrolase
VRGLSSLYILKQLMEVTNPDNPPKPCNFFDMIGGTSTGGCVNMISYCCRSLIMMVEVLLL